MVLINPLLQILYMIKSCHSYQFQTCCHYKTLQGQNYSIKVKFHVAQPYVERVPPYPFWTGWHYNKLRNGYDKLSQVNVRLSW